MYEDGMYKLKWFFVKKSLLNKRTIKKRVKHDRILLCSLNFVVLRSSWFIAQSPETERPESNAECTRPFHWYQRSHTGNISENMIPKFNLISRIKSWKFWFHWANQERLHSLIDENLTFQLGAGKLHTHIQSLQIRHDVMRPRTYLDAEPASKCDVIDGDVCLVPQTPNCLQHKVSSWPSSQPHCAEHPLLPLVTRALPQRILIPVVMAKHNLRVVRSRILSWGNRHLCDMKPTTLGHGGRGVHTHCASRTRDTVERDTMREHFLEKRRSFPVVSGFQYKGCSVVHTKTGAIPQNVCNFQFRLCVCQMKGQTKGIR